MTVSRAGKKGTHARLRRTNRNGRVKFNAKLASRQRPGAVFGGAEWSNVYVGKGSPHQPDVRPATTNDNLSPLALCHGRYETVDTIFRPSVIETELEERVVNRAVTIIDDWIDDDVFERRHTKVIEAARDLWRDIRRPRHPYFDPYDPDEHEDGADSERAKNLLRRCRHFIGNYRWNIFENVIRWNEPTGVPGSRIANVRSSAIIGAQNIVRDVAEQIYRARILW